MNSYLNLIFWGISLEALRGCTVKLWKPRWSHSLLNWTTLYKGICCVLLLSVAWKKSHLSTNLAAMLNVGKNDWKFFISAFIKLQETADCLQQKILEGARLCREKWTIHKSIRKAEVCFSLKSCVLQWPCTYVCFSEGMLWAGRIEHWELNFWYWFVWITL